MKDLINFGKGAAIISFLIGTILFSLLCYLGESRGLINLIVYFGVIALITNSLIFIIGTFACVISKNNRLELFKTLLLMLLNIPIVIMYFLYATNFVFK